MWGEEKPRHRWNFPLAGNETLCLVLRRAGGGTFLFRQESTQRDDLGGGGGRDVKHPNTASPQDPPLVRRLVVRKRIQVQDNPSVKLPEIGTLPAPFTQGSLWWVDRGCGARIAFGDVILQGKMTGPSGRPAPTNSIGVRGKKEDRSEGSVLNFSFFIFHFSLCWRFGFSMRLRPV